MNKILLVVILYLVSLSTFASVVLIPMDETQKNHLKAYGIAYEALKEDIDVEWMLNYRGGSFAIAQTDNVIKLCKLRGVTYELVSDATYQSIVNEIADPEVNMDIVKLQRLPK